MFKFKRWHFYDQEIVILVICATDLAAESMVDILEVDFYHSLKREVFYALQPVLSAVYRLSRTLRISASPRQL